MGDSSAAEAGSDWRRQRKSGMVAIAGSIVVCAALWLGVRYFGPVAAGMEEIGPRMLFALKCCCIATLFCLVTGVEAIAHERLQTPAFDPLQGFRTRRLRVNLRYLQNTLEQWVVFAVGLFGLAAYSPGGGAMRAVLATTVTWILGRIAFWIGYHRSAAMRGAGAAGMAVSLVVLLYVAGRIGYEIAGTAGTAGVVGAYLLFEAFLFRATRGSD